MGSDCISSCSLLIFLLIGSELGRYKRQQPERSFGAGYTFFWSEQKRKEMHEAGVGFAIKKGLIGKLSGQPKGIDLLL